MLKYASYLQLATRDATFRIYGIALALGTATLFTRVKLTVILKQGTLEPLLTKRTGKANDFVVLPHKNKQDQLRDAMS